MIFTTNRYAPKELRELAQRLALVFSGAYVARGKKTVNQLVDEARKKGHPRVCFVMPKRLDALAVDELGNWEWVGRIRVDSFSSTGKLTACESLEDETLAGLLGFTTNEKGEDTATVKNGKLYFSSETGSFELVFKHERKLHNTD